MDKPSIDSLLLDGLHSGRQLTQIISELEDALGLELGLYSLDLQQLPSNARARLPGSFENAFASSSGTEAGLRSEYFSVDPEGRRCCVSPIIRDGVQLGIIVVYTRDGALSREELHSLSVRLSKFCAFFINAEISSSQRHSYESLWLTGAVFSSNTGFDITSDAGIAEKLRGGYVFCAFLSPSRQIRQLRNAERDLGPFLSQCAAHNPRERHTHVPALAQAGRPLTPPPPFEKNSQHLPSGINSSAASLTALTAFPTGISTSARPSPAWIWRSPIPISSTLESTIAGSFLSG